MGRPKAIKDSPERKAAFCAALVVSGGNVSRACEAVGIDRTTPYVWRDADPVFAEAWAKAKEQGGEVLEDEARRRAFEGVEKPVYQGGVQVGTIREYSDLLITFLLKGVKPEVYRERYDARIGMSLEALVAATIDTPVPALLPLLEQPLALPSPSQQPAVEARPTEHSLALDPPLARGERDRAEGPTARSELDPWGPAWRTERHERR